jgi:hypothetical protein
VSTTVYYCLSVSYRHSCFLFALLPRRPLRGRPLPETTSRELPVPRRELAGGGWRELAGAYAAGGKHAQHWEGRALQR